MKNESQALSFFSGKHQILQQALQQLDSRVLLIAVKGEEELYSALELLTQNAYEPGSLANYIKSLRKTDKLGRQRPLVIAGSSVEKLLIAFTQACSGDIRKGLTRKQVAKLFGMSSTDSKVQQAGQALGNLFEEALGIRVKWHKSRLRLVTINQLQQEQPRHEKSIIGYLRRFERDQEYMKLQNATKTHEVIYQLSFWELTDGVQYDDAA